MGQSECGCVEICNTCDNCSSCCTCRYCEGCDQKVNEDQWCSNCERCTEDCCTCWWCDGCREDKAEDVEQCADCECCPDCCECNKDEEEVPNTVVFTAHEPGGLIISNGEGNYEKCTRCGGSALTGSDSCHDGPWLCERCLGCEGEVCNYADYDKCPHVQRLKGTKSGVLYESDIEPD